MAFRAILERENPLERRQAERWRIRLGARRLDSRPDASTLSILDVSHSGILFETEEALRVGACLIVEMPGKICKVCKTIWNCGNYHGATFSEDLREAELQELVRSRLIAEPLDELLELSAGHSNTPSSVAISDNCPDEEAKLPPATRFVIILGASAALWSMIGTGIWLSTG